MSLMLLRPVVLLCSAILCSVTFSSVIIRALDGQSELGSRSDAHQMFLLRDSVSTRPQSPDFYSGEVACAFNDTATCEEKFKRVLATAPKSVAAKQIHHILAYVALREGQYGRALHEMDAVLAIDPQDDDAKDTRPFVEALSHFPNQSVRGGSGRKASLRMKDGKLPLLINGKKASYFFDTGANLSTLTESEAARLGMQIHEVTSKAASTDINGNQVLFRVALAKSLALGGIVLDNVAFLVASNEQEPFVEMAPGDRGLIGLPVLLALGSMRWSRDGTFEADRSRKTAGLVRANQAKANLCFDDLLLITLASFEQHELSFVLDTGAETTELWPKFGDAAAELIRQSGSREIRTVTGMGGEQKFEAISIPKVSLQLGGKSVTLQPAHVLQSQERAVSKWFSGNLGIDLLGQARTVSIDFRTMTLGLDTVPERLPTK